MSRLDTFALLIDSAKEASEKAAQEYAQKQAAVARLEEALTEAVARTEAASRDQRQHLLSKAAFDPVRLQVAAAWIQGLRANEALIQEQTVSARAEEETARKALIAARLKQRQFELVRDKLLAEIAHKKGRQEQKMFDEMSSQGWQRRLRAEREEQEALERAREALAV